MAKKKNTKDEKPEEEKTESKYTKLLDRGGLLMPTKMLYHRPSYQGEKLDGKEVMFCAKGRVHAEKRGTSCDPENGMMYYVEIEEVEMK